MFEVIWKMRRETTLTCLAKPEVEVDTAADFGWDSRSESLLNDMLLTKIRCDGVSRHLECCRVGVGRQAEGCRGEHVLAIELCRLRSQ